MVNQELRSRAMLDTGAAIGLVSAGFLADVEYKSYQPTH